MTNELKLLLYKLIKYLIIVITAAFIFDNCKGCERGCSVIPNNHKSDLKVIDSLDKQDKSNEIKQTPIVKKIDNIAILTAQLNIEKAKLYKAGRVTIVNNPCNLDSILNTYDSLYNSCEVESNSYKQAIRQWRYLDSLKQLRIDLRGLEIDRYKIIVKKDSLIIDSLTYSRKKYWRGFKHGFIIGSSIGAVGTSLIK